MQDTNNVDRKEINRSESIQFGDAQNDPVLSVDKIDGFSLTSEGYLCKVTANSFPTAFLNPQHCNILDASVI